MSNSKNLPDYYGWPPRQDGSLNTKKRRSAVWVSDDGSSYNLNLGLDVSSKKLLFFARTDVEQNGGISAAMAKTIKIKKIRKPDYYGWPKRRDGSLNYKKDRSAAWISFAAKGFYVEIGLDVSSKKLRFFNREVVENWKK